MCDGVCVCVNILKKSWLCEAYGARLYGWGEEGVGETAWYEEQLPAGRRTVQTWPPSRSPSTQ